MNYFIFTLGALIVCLVLFEVFATTLAPRGAYIITKWLRIAVWELFFRLSGGRGTNKLLNYAGMATVTAWLFGWLFMLWVGNILLYISDNDSVLVSQTSIVASTWEKVYFVGYVLSTMGLGDFEPNGEGWKVYTSVISFSGFIIITISVTYLVPVISAEMAKRKASVYIHSFGTSPNDILLNAWDGESFSRLTQHFTVIAEFIMEQSQQHVAYPILHNFHSHIRRESMYINLTALDEALTILLLYLPDDVKPNKQEIYPLRYAITEFLTTLKNAFIKSSKDSPGPLQLDQLRNNGIPLKQKDSIIEGKLEKLSLRRKVLLGMLQNDGWDWDSIFMETEYAEFDLEHPKETEDKSKKNQ